MPVEGVETKTQARLVRNLGCTDMQGHFISRPVPDTASRD
jgi:EAL domain-containing protein (putative c-di-GMP-specific phosphodiesterase class I)